MGENLKVSIYNLNLRDNNLSNWEFDSNAGVLYFYNQGTSKVEKKLVDLEEWSYENFENSSILTNFFKRLSNKEELDKLNNCILETKYNFGSEYVLFMIESSKDNIIKGKCTNITKAMEPHFDNRILDINNDKNRKYIKKLIEDSIKEKQNRGAVILIDLDNFKFINNSFGYNKSELFLKEVKINISKIIKEENFIFRIGGDEFLIFLPNIKDKETVEEISKNIIEVFDKTYNIEGDSIYTTVSIGVALFPDDGISFDIIFKNANEALGTAKSNGKYQYQLFNKNISQELSRLYSIERELRTALDNQELYVVFQPKVKLSDDTVMGFESLLRWNNEKLGNVSPMDFIPIAEANRMIIPIGTFVLEEVCSKIKYLSKNGHKDFKIAVNLSEVQLREGNIVEILEVLIKKYKINPKHLEIEITESLLMKSFSKNIETLIAIKDLGISIALDDFGTGYSSLNYLTKLPIDVLKIDRSFVNDMMENNKSKYIVENIIQLSHKLGIQVVAEGVEIKEQIKYLRSILCDVVQGYYYSRPEKFDDVKNMLPE